MTRWGWMVLVAGCSSSSAAAAPRDEAAPREDAGGLEASASVPTFTVEPSGTSTTTASTTTTASATNFSATASATATDAGVDSSSRDAGVDSSPPARDAGVDSGRVYLGWSGAYAACYVSLVPYQCPASVAPCGFVCPAGDYSPPPTEVSGPSGCLTNLYLDDAGDILFCCPVSQACPAGK